MADLQSSVHVSTSHKSYDSQWFPLNRIHSIHDKLDKETYHNHQDLRISGNVIVGTNVEYVCTTDYGATDSRFTTTRKS